MYKIYNSGQQDNNNYNKDYDNIVDENPMDSHTKIKGLLVKILFVFFALTTVWLFEIEYFSFSSSTVNISNPYVSGMALFGVLLSVYIIYKSVKCLDKEETGSIILLTVMLFFASVLMIISFFAPISFIYILPVMLILVPTVMIFVSSKLSLFQKLIAVAVVVAVCFCAFQNASKISYLQQTPKAKSDYSQTDNQQQDDSNAEITF